MREIKFRVRRKDGTLIGYERFKTHHWECATIEQFHKFIFEVQAVAKAYNAIAIPPMLP